MRLLQVDSSSTRSFHTLRAFARPLELSSAVDDMV
jgi:hypothetical protein